MRLCTASSCVERYAFFCETWFCSWPYRCQLSTEEQQKIISAFNKPDEVREHGVHLSGKKFFVLRADERSVYGRKGVSILGTFYFLLTSLSRFRRDE